ncbi:MAG: hypothetical protein ACTSU2_14420 [Promethearchaeota archaeon]
MKKREDNSKDKPDDTSLEKVLEARFAEEKRLLGQDLTDEERAVLDCFIKPRLVLQRIYIVYNQTRNALGKPVKKESEIRQTLGVLEEKGYITIEKFEYNGEEREAFVLTEKGQQLLE